MSDTFELDLSGFVPNQSAYIPPGEYLVVVEDMEEMVSSTGNPMWKLTDSVLTEGEFQGMTLVDFLTLTPKALWRVVSFLNAVGIPTPKKKLSIPKGMLVGKTFIAVVIDDEYKGQVKSKIVEYRSASAGSTVVVSSDLPEDEDAPVSQPKLAAVPDPEPEDEPVAAAKPTNARVQAKPVPDEDLDL